MVDIASWLTFDLAPNHMLLLISTSR